MASVPQFVLMPFYNSQKFGSNRRLARCIHVYCSLGANLVLTISSSGNWVVVREAQRAPAVFAVLLTILSVFFFYPSIVVCAAFKGPLRLI
jgi:hypothetical protein